MTRVNRLFVCSRNQNQWRSPTAEQVFRDDPRVSVRSRGLSPRSPRRLSAADLAWADLVFVMESSHRARITGTMRETLGDTPVHVLNIPDDYPFMDPELVELLLDRVGWHVRDVPLHSE